jgi:hypothetical protein
MLTPCLATMALSRAGSCAAARSASTTHAPSVSGSHSSSTAMSNDSEVRPSTQSMAVMPGRSAMVARKFVTASWRTITPLGTPVEPEV